jgi:hypothetical protein
MPGGCAIPADLNARPARPVSALPSTGDVIRAIEDLAGQGADTVYFHLYGPSDVEHVRLLGSEVVSRFLPEAVPPLPNGGPCRPPVRHHNDFLAKLVGAGTCLPAFTVGVVRPHKGLAAKLVGAGRCLRASAQAA